MLRCNSFFIFPIFIMYYLLFSAYHNNGQQRKTYKTAPDIKKRSVLMQMWVSCCPRFRAAVYYVAQTDFEEWGCRKERRLHYIYNNTDCPHIQEKPTLICVGFSLSINSKFYFRGGNAAFFVFPLTRAAEKHLVNEKSLINKVPIVSLCFMIQIIVTINNKIRIKDDIKIVILTFFEWLSFLSISLASHKERYSAAYCLGFPNRFSIFSIVRLPCDSQKSIKLVFNSASRCFLNAYG